MIEKKMDDNKDSETAIDEPLANLALVIRMPISRMPEGIHYLQGLPGTRIIYQKTSVGRLRIVADD